MATAEHSRAYRARKRDDVALLTVSENRVTLHALLQAAGALDETADDDNQTLAAGLKNLLAQLRRKIP
jgi:hypothetical protein